MSIATQISRISGNVTAALTAIGNKGVTVPSGSDSDDLATLIAAIPAGLEYETGTYTPSSNVNRPSISFSKTHSETPFYVMMADTKNTTSTAKGSRFFSFIDWYRLFGTGVPQNGSTMTYAYMFGLRYDSGLATVYTACTYNSDSTESGYNYCSRYWVTNSNFRPYTNTTSCNWLSTRTYKWIAVWKPTT